MKNFTIGKINSILSDQMGDFVGHSFSGAFVFVRHRSKEEALAYAKEYFRGGECRVLTSSEVPDDVPLCVPIKYVGHTTE